MREEKKGSEFGRLLATTGWLLGGEALGLPVHEFLATTSETTRLQEEVDRLQLALAEERRKRQASEQAITDWSQHFLSQPFNFEQSTERARLKNGLPGDNLRIYLSTVMVEPNPATFNKTPALEP